MTNVNFVLENFAIDKTLDVSGVFDTSNIPTLDVDTTATYYVSLESIKNTFLYSPNNSDSNTNDFYVDFYVDTSNIDGSNFGGKLTTNGEYGYANNTGAFYFNPTLAFAGTSNIGYTDSNINKRTVAHDFIRSIAVNMFNTYKAESLFRNNDLMIRNIRDKFGFFGDNTDSKVNGAMYSVIFNKLNSISMQHGNCELPIDSNGYKYVDATTLKDPNDNITKILMDQMMGAQPLRFANLGDSNIVPNFTNLRTLPFCSGDTISFKLTIHPADNQATILSNETTVNSRSYEIKMILVPESTIDNSNINPQKELADLPL